MVTHHKAAYTSVIEQGLQSKNCCYGQVVDAYVSYQHVSYHIYTNCAIEEKNGDQHR